MEAEITSSDVKVAPAPGGVGPTAAGRAMQAANTLIRNEKAEDARHVLGDFLEDNDHPDVWMKLAKVYRMMGETVVARSIYRNVIHKVAHPHVMEVITARIPATKALVLQDAKIIYVNIPKCGSSSIKDAVLFATKRELRRETSHFHVREYEKILPFGSLTGEYADFTKFAVIRPPRARLRSYFTKNITEAGSLVAEANGRETYYGLETRPSYGTVLANFAQYRCIFDDFRHHTDSIVGYLGQDRGRYTHLFAITETQKAIALFEGLCGGEMPVIHNMKSENQDPTFSVADVEREAALVDSVYKRELEVFFSP